MVLTHISCLLHALSISFPLIWPHMVKSTNYEAPLVHCLHHSVTFSLRSKLPPQDPVLQHTQICVLPIVKVKL